MDGLDEELRTLGESTAHDYSTSVSGGIVPLNRRRSAWSMAALWLTFSGGFAGLLFGYTFHEAGMPLWQTAGVIAVGGLIYIFVYALWSNYLGSRTGMTNALITRSIFGRYGSWTVALCQVVFGLGFVGFMAGVSAQIYSGLFGWKDTTELAMILAAAAVATNLFGFTGVIAWARYVVAPIFLVWVTYTIVRALVTDSDRFSADPPSTSSLTLLGALALMVGASTWGDEADFWRYGKPKFWWPVLPLLFALFAGFVPFVSAGWIIADISAGDFSESITFITDYALFGAVWLAFIVATVGQQALQDGNYYIGINALQNLLGGIPRWRRLYSCALAAAAATFFTWLLRQSPDAWITFIQFIAATVPSATVISITDHFLVPRVFRLSRPLTRVPSWQETGAVNVPAVVALACAVFVGVAGNGRFPWFGLEGAFWYAPALLAWLTALSVYVAGVALVRSRADALKWLGYGERWRDAAHQALIRTDEPIDLASQAGVFAPNRLPRHP
ncbi:MAG: cytosine permease [Actinomycetota bacterium]|nr:cytosine permease [Actinomycetota bacterium]